MFMLLIIKLRHKQANQNEIEVRLKFTKAPNLVKIPQSSNITSFAINDKQKHQPNYTSCKQIMNLDVAFISDRVFCIYTSQTISVITGVCNVISLTYIHLIIYVTYIIYIKITLYINHYIHTIILFPSLYSLF